MPRKKTIDPKALIKAVESGTPRREIMRQFGFKSPVQVNTYYLDALIDAGKAKQIKSRQPKAANVEKIVKVSKRGSISVPKQMLTEMGFKIGDSFKVNKTRAGLILKIQ